MRIPDTTWIQTNQGNKLGNLRDTFNVDLLTPGQLIGAKKSTSFLHTDAHGSLSYPLAIVYYAGNYIVITSDEAYTFGLTTTTASTISSYPGGVSVNSDAVVCYNRLYISLDNNLSYWDGSSWTNSIEALTTSVPHPMEVFDSLPTYKLVIGDGNTVILVDSSGNKDSTVLTLPAQFRVTTMRYRNGYLYVGTRNIYGGESRVFIWNGSGTNAQYEVPTGASWVFAMTAFRSTVAFVTDRGQLMYVNGSSAESLANFPIYYAKNTRWQDHQGLQLNGKVFNRGIAQVGDSIYINIDGEVDIGECLEMKSGLWVFNSEVGLYHNAQASNDRVRTDSSFSVSNSEITTSADHYLKTGDAVVFTNVTGLTGINANQTYYATVTASNKLKISLSRKAVKMGEFVTIGGTFSSETLLYSQNRDQGIRHHTSGAIGRIVSMEEVPPLFAGEIMYGARVEDRDGTDKYTVQILVDSYNVSRFTTQRLYAKEIEQAWNTAHLFLDGFKLDNEEIILKEQIAEELPRQVMTGAWLSTSSINVAVDGNDVTSVSEGDEVVITDGYGRGYTAFVTEISNSSSVYTFTVDEAIGTINSPVTFYTTPKRKLVVRDPDSVVKGYVKAKVSSASPWLSLSGEMRGYQTELSHINLINQVEKTGN